MNHESPDYFTNHKLDDLQDYLKYEIQITETTFNKKLLRSKEKMIKELAKGERNKLKISSTRIKGLKYGLKHKFIR